MNRELVAQGAAWWYRDYARADFRLEQLESEARAAHRGLWAQPNPVPPWTWRKGDATQVEVIGNRSSRVYHRPHCRSLARMKDSNRAPFKSVAEAEAQGFRATGDCR